MKKAKGRSDSPLIFMDRIKSTFWRTVIGAIGATILVLYAAAFVILPYLAFTTVLAVLGGSYAVAAFGITLFSLFFVFLFIVNLFIGD